MNTLQRILDWVEQHRRDWETLRVVVGVWDAGAAHAAYYATLVEADDNILFGESTYGSDSADEALALLLDEVRAHTPGRKVRL